jgi:hypothetical protein
MDLDKKKKRLQKILRYLSFFFQFVLGHLPKTVLSFSLFQLENTLVLFLCVVAVIVVPELLWMLDKDI